MVSYLIEGGSVVDPLNKKIERRDLLIADGKFQDLDKKKHMYRNNFCKGQVYYPWTI